MRIKKVSSKDINRTKLRIFYDYLENKAETKKMHGGNLGPLDVFY